MPLHVVRATVANQHPWAVRGLTGRNDPVTPNTQYRFAADAIQLYRANDNPITIINVAEITCDIALAGPIVNGRDQVGAFAASNWIHFYYIYNGVAVGLIASLTSPPTGPTLPTGYYAWGYCHAVRYNATPVLLQTVVRGAMAFFVTRETALADGSATSETAINLSTFIPPNALTSYCLFVVIGVHPGPTEAAWTFRHIAGSDFFNPGISIAVANERHRFGGAVIFPGTQTIYYQWQSGLIPSVVRSLSLYPLGYAVANGDS